MKQHPALLLAWALACGWAVPAGAVEPVSTVSAAEQSGYERVDDLKYYALAGEGRLPLRASARMSGYYDSNIYLGDDDKTDDFVWELNPSIGYESNDPTAGFPYYLLVMYDPTLVFFTKHDEENSVDHAGEILFRHQGAKMDLMANHRSFQASGASRDVGNRAERTVHDTTVSGDYQATGKVRLETSLRQTLSNYERQNDKKHWSGEFYALYEVAPKVDLGLGTRIGWMNMENSPDQRYQQALGRAVYRPTEKLVFDLAGGVDYRQYQGAEARGDKITPAFSLEGSWFPLENTSLSLRGYRGIEGSTSITASNYIATGVESVLRQKVMDRFHYNLSGGYENADYYSTRRDNGNDRADNYFFVRNSLDYEFNQWVSAEIYHRYENNDSNVSEFSRNQVGFSVFVRY
jgi:hypothetical protein